MGANNARMGRTITTPYGEARVNPAGRILWAEWEVWRHSEELVAAGLWTSKRAGYGTRERIEFYAVEHEGQRAAPGPTDQAERAER